MREKHFPVQSLFSLPPYASASLSASVILLTCSLLSIPAACELVTVRLTVLPFPLQRGGIDLANVPPPSPPPLHPSPVLLRYCFTTQKQRCGEESEGGVRWLERIGCLHCVFYELYKEHGSQQEDTNSHCTAAPSPLAVALSVPCCCRCCGSVLPFSFRFDIAMIIGEGRERVT